MTTGIQGKLPCIPAVNIERGTNRKCSLYVTVMDIFVPVLYYCVLICILGQQYCYLGEKNVDKHFEKYEFLVFLILTKSSMRLFFFFFGREKEMVGTELK